MAVSSGTVKLVLVAVAVVLVVMVVLSFVWEALKVVVGILIGAGLIYLGLRFLMGKGLPKGVARAAKKVIDVSAVAVKDVAKDGKDKAEDR